MAGSGGCVLSDGKFSLAVLIPALALAGLVIPRFVVIIAIVALIVVRYRRTLYIAYVTLPRDYRFGKRFISVLIQTRKLKKENATVVTKFNALVAKHPDRTCFFFEDRSWTFKEVSEYSNRVANLFHDAGYRHGDTVALCLDNRPEYVCIWLGLARLGVITALINTNLRLQPLIHSLQVAKAKGIIFGEQQASAFQDISETLGKSADIYQLEPLKVELTLEGTVVKSLGTLLEAASTSPPKVDKPPDFRDKLMYIYTSGTTGLPKAAIIPHSRYLFISVAQVQMLDFRQDDIMYNPLPMYHTSGGILGVGPAIIEGIPVAIRKKFSASGYWKDCIKYNCSIGQYIGEICRYILAVPPMPEDRQHRVRLMLGNGMRSSIWSEFVQRFNIAHVAELYGATEGNANIVNLDGTIGAVGFLPRFVPVSISRMGIIRVDNDTGVPLRDKKGLCIQCDIDEPGMYVGIISSGDMTREYHGYVDKVASKRKVISDVFRKGDQAFLSGDILMMNELGYLFFQDRTGDTFRWKGENVATAEIEAVISNILSLRDCTVYGVEIQGQEGRAGMAAIADADGTLDLTVLASGVERTLPSYARPIFVRAVKQVDLTGTYKMKKVDLQKEGFNPTIIKDRLFVRQGSSYIALTEEVYNDILSGKMRV